MSNKNLIKIAAASGWLLLAMLILYFISGYAMVQKYGMDTIMARPQALFWHKYLTIPFFVFLVLHIAPYYIVRKQVKRLLLISGLLIALSVFGVYTVNKFVKLETKQHKKFLHRQEKSVTCPNCPKGCIIKEGEYRECGKYKNLDGKLLKEQESG